MPYDFNALVAVELDDRIVCIGRILSDDGTIAVVRSDEQIEREAATEYGFPPLPARTLTVSSRSLRPIVERVN